MKCPHCGRNVRQRKAAFCDACGLPLTQNAVSVQQPGTAQQTPVQQPGKKRRRVKWWMIVLPILIAALAAGGIWYARTQKQYTTVSYYDEDGEQYSEFTYDEDGNVISAHYLDASQKWKLKKTDASKSFDTSEDEQVKGVRRVECWQRVVEYDDGDPQELNIEVWAYDKKDNLIMVHSYFAGSRTTCSITTYEYHSNGKRSHSRTESYSNFDGELVSITETEYDGHGKLLREEVRTANGELVSEAEYENSYVLGTLRKMTLTRKTYMEIDYTTASAEYVVLDDPVTTSYAFKYHYTFGLLTNADAVRETDAPGVEEDIWEYRIEYGYD